MTSPFFLKALAKAQPGWRRVVAQATSVFVVPLLSHELMPSLWGIPIPAHTTAVSRDPNDEDALTHSSPSLMVTVPRRYPPTSSRPSETTSAVCWVRT